MALPIAFDIALDVAKARPLALPGGRLR